MLMAMDGKSFLLFPQLSRARIAIEIRRDLLPTSEPCGWRWRDDETDFRTCRHGSSSWAFGGGGCLRKNECTIMIQHLLGMETPCPSMEKQPEVRRNKTKSAANSQFSLDFYCIASPADLQGTGWPEEEIVLWKNFVLSSVAMIAVLSPSRWLTLLGCANGCPARQESSASMPASRADGLLTGNQVVVPSWCLTHTGVKP